MSTLIRAFTLQRHLLYSCTCFKYLLEFQGVPRFAHLFSVDWMFTSVEKKDFWIKDDKTIHVLTIL